MAKKQNLLPWLSVGSEGRFNQVGNKFMLHKNVINLPASAFKLYFAICNEAGKKSEVTFSHGTAKKYGITKTTFDRAVKVLISRRFIVRVQNNDMSRFAKGKYKFCLDWKIDSS